MTFFPSSRRWALAASVLLAATGTAAAQTMPNAVRVAPTRDSSSVYTYVEQMPQLPGGGSNAAIMAAIQARVAPTGGCGGKVFVSFVVGPSGVVREAKIIKGLAASCDEAVLAAVRQLPRFSPGRQNRRPVSVVLTVPITF
ncbi:energy transducer TonB [Hymenobacter nivis]|uniref:Energy transducer TonB n=1 Tax=Hymenobacter nivis TaxID=1850093 RepID=A0A502GNC6_9BACT|nr:energy transducer TonB [Hymenobacter nivis]TPG62393.1 energy transducer TonB [Hymenobacter nivis]